jgi:hypothetical protein
MMINSTSSYHTVKISLIIFVMNCNQTVMSLPPLTSVIFLIAKSFWSNAGVLEKCLCNPFEDKA